MASGDAEPASWGDRGLTFLWAGAAAEEDDVAARETGVVYTDTS